jgi:tripartite ATP-independent transporter DctM subunit
VSIVKLFIAGIVPGLLLAAIFMVYIAVACRLRPELAPRMEVRQRWAQVVGEVVKLGPFVALIGMVLGSMYMGYATPTEAAAIGVTAAVVVSALFGRFSTRLLWLSASRSVSSSCTILLIVAMAFIFSYAIDNAQIGSNLARALVAMNLDRVSFLIAICLMYAVLGCIMDSVGMIMVTVPLLFPTIVALGIDPIWFGVLLVLQVELGQITPPFGINLFVVQGIAGCKLGDVIRGCVPFFGIFALYIVLITVFPEIVMWLPRRAGGA